MVNQSLIKFEIKQLIEHVKLPQAMILYMFMIVIIFTMMLNPEISSIVTPILIILIQSITILNLSHFILGKDFLDGTFELILSCKKLNHYIISKIISINLISALSNIVISAIIYFIFDISEKKILYFFVASILTSLTATSVSVVFSAMEIYFENSSLMHIILIPFLIPILILSGLVISTLSSNYIFIMIGINLIIFPICLVLCKYLSENIYNY